MRFHPQPQYAIFFHINNSTFEGSPVATSLAGVQIVKVDQIAGKKGDLVGEVQWVSSAQPQAELPIVSNNWKAMLR